MTTALIVFAFFAGAGVLFAGMGIGSYFESKGEALTRKIRDGLD
jgi:hypothetical protein